MIQLHPFYLLAVKATIDAAKVIMDVYNSNIGVKIKEDGSRNTSDILV